MKTFIDAIRLLASRLLVALAIAVGGLGLVFFLLSLVTADSDAWLAVILIPLSIGFLLFMAKEIHPYK